MKKDIPTIHTSWTEEQVREFLRTENPSYQRIQLPYGLTTRGANRSVTSRTIFPDDMTGKSVLDIGCKLGFFCFEAMKRGASRVVGIDMDIESIRKARLIADCLQLPAEFILLDIERDSLEEQFDYVLCLNVLHHLTNPFSALEKLISLTKDSLVLETANIGSHDRKRIGLSFIQSVVLSKLPVIIPVAPKRGYRSASKRYYFSQKAIGNILAQQFGVLAEIETTPSDFKDRFVTIARRRKIDRIVVVAGPKASGKSTLIGRILSGELPDVANQIGLHDQRDWVTCQAKRLSDIEGRPLKNLLLHYDILRPLSTKTKTFDRDPALSLLQTTSNVTFLTIAEPQKVLSAQLKKRRLPDKQLDLAEKYDDPNWVREIYHRWFAFCDTHPAKHFVISQSGGMRPYNSSEQSSLLQKASQ